MRIQFSTTGLLPEGVSSPAKKLVHILTKAAPGSSKITSLLTIIKNKIQALENALKLGRGSRKHIGSSTHYEDDMKVNTAGTLRMANMKLFLNEMESISESAVQSNAEWLEHIQKENALLVALSEPDTRKRKLIRTIQ